MPSQLRIMDLDPAAPPLFRLMPEKVIKKVPGHLLPITSRDKEALLDDLTSKTTAQLMELRDRQEKILSNKFLLNKLKDKGSKATELKQRIERELKSRLDVDKTADLLAQMSLDQLGALEWTGHCRPGYRSKMSSEDVEDSESEEIDPLKILASHSGVTLHQKQIRIMKTEENLITREDFAETKIKDEDMKRKLLLGEGTESLPLSSKLSGVVCDSLEKRPEPSTSDTAAINAMTQSLPCPSLPHLQDEPVSFDQHICNQFGHKTGKDRFKPNKPLKPFTGVFPIKPPGRISSKINRMELTNVTPPLPKFVDTKLLTLEESLELQQQQAQKLKVVQMKHAAEKLLTLGGVKFVGELPHSVSLNVTHRKPNEFDSESDDEINQTDDEEESDRGTSVVYDVMS